MAFEVSDDRRAPLKGPKVESGEWWHKEPRGLAWICRRGAFAQCQWWLRTCHLKELRSLHKIVGSVSELCFRLMCDAIMSATVGIYLGLNMSLAWDEVF